MRTTPVLAAGLAAVVLLGAAGCSNGGGTPKAASATSQTPSSAAGTTASAGTAPASTATSTAHGAVNPNTPEVNAAGDIPDSQVFVAYSPPSGGYTVKVPEGWARTAAPDGAVTFTDKLNSVRIESVPAPAAPTVASATQSEVPRIRAASAGFEAGTVTTANRPAGPAVLVTYRADSAPDPVTGKVVHDDVERYEFWKAGTEVVLTLSGPVGADNVDPWRTVTDSFGWK